MKAKNNFNIILEREIWGGFVREFVVNSRNLFLKCTTFSQTFQLFWKHGYTSLERATQNFLHFGKVDWAILCPQKIQLIFWAGANMSCLKPFTGEHLTKNNMFQLNKIDAKFMACREFSNTFVDISSSFVYCSTTMISSHPYERLLFV